MPDAQQQLQQARHLLQAGKKREAGVVIQSVLESDKRNVTAWWMLANLIDDQQKKIKTLERILKLDPTHEGAHALLQRLQAPTVGDNSDADGDLNDLFAKAESELQAQGTRIAEVPAVPAQDAAQPSASLAQQLLASPILFYGGIIGILGLVVLAVSLIFGGAVDDGTPVAASQSYVDALVTRDFDAFRTLTCTASSARVDTIERTMRDALSQLNLDASGLGYRQLERTDDRARVEISGTLGLRVQGTQADSSMRFNDIVRAVDDPLFASEMQLVREGGGWRVCAD
jgi:hypothetical protein